MIATQHAVEKYSAGRDYGKREVPHFALHGAVVKPCNRCGRVKPIEEFGKHNLTWDGRQNACLACTGPEGLGPTAATERQPIASPLPPLRPHRSAEAYRESNRRGVALAHAARAKKAASQRKPDPPAPKPASSIPDAPPPGPGRVLADPWTKGGAR
jgi:hypothetical protein